MNPASCSNQSNLLSDSPTAAPIDTGEAYAKINLSLSVLGKQDGYHLLDSTVITVDLSDKIELLKENCLPEVLWLSGAVPAGNLPKDNNTFRTIVALSEACGRPGCRVRITRNIPDGAGLGGSSAQAAGVLRLLCRRWDLALDDPRVTGIADAIGSDVKALLVPGLKRITGRGQNVEPLPDPPPLHFVVAASGRCATKDVFEKFDFIKDELQMTNDEWLSRETKINQGAESRDILEKFKSESNLNSSFVIRHSSFEQNCQLYNALLPAAILLNPAIGEVLKSIAATEPLHVGMTGSGSACFGVYKTAAAAHLAAASIRADFVTVCRSVGLIDTADRR